MSSPAIIPSLSAIKLFQARDQEVLWVGPAGTGKTFSLALFARMISEAYPGSRGLFIRQTRKALNNSLLDIWEDEILGPGHPAITPSRGKEARSSYWFPQHTTIVDGRTYAGRSRIDLVGMDTPDRIMSTQYDWVAFVECTEGFLSAWARISSRLRRYYIYRWGRPWSIQIADCNPAYAGHWLNKRADEILEISPKMQKRLGCGPTMPSMLRITTTLKDNPKFWCKAKQDWTDEGVAYNLILDKLPPTERARLRDGLWTSQSGQVYPEFSREKHVVNGYLEQDKDDDRQWWLKPVLLKARQSRAEVKGDFEARRVAWFFVATDWGYLPDPGTIGLYAVDEQARAFMVKEVYQTEKPLEWWAKRIVTWQKTYDVRAIVCEHPKEKVRTLNDLMGNKLNDLGEPIARLAKKGPGSIMAGIEIVRFALGDDNEGEPRLRYFSGALEHEPDSTLKELFLPTCGVDEYDAYVFPERVDDKTQKELPRDLNNHGLDRDRYACGYLWHNQHNPIPAPAEPWDPLVIYDDSDELEKQHYRELRRKGARQRI